jgi:hypothetical protein
MRVTVKGSEVSKSRISSSGSLLRAQLPSEIIMPSPDKVDSEGTDKPTNPEPERHAEYYFAFTTFLVSDIDDSDQAD